MPASLSLLAADVGNSRIKYGWFEAESAASAEAWPACRQFTATSLEAPVPVELLSRWAGTPSPRLVLAGSNPQHVERIATDWQRQTGTAPWILRDRNALRLEIAVDAPEKVGLDRLLNAVAANALRPPQRAAIVIDSGTATTIDLITVQGEFAGGAILPGLALSAQALHHYTALLPQLSLSDLGPDQPVPLGRSTRAALRSGIYWGQVGAIREIAQAICAEVGLSSPWSNDTSATPWLLLTGGGAPWLGAQFSAVRQIPSLAMHGLVLAAWQLQS